MRLAKRTASPVPLYFKVMMRIRDAALVAAVAANTASSMPMHNTTHNNLPRFFIAAPVMRW